MDRRPTAPHDQPELLRYVRCPCIPLQDFALGLPADDNFAFKAAVRACVFAGLT